jgi:hypothetical protein
VCTVLRRVAVVLVVLVARVNAVAGPAQAVSQGNYYASVTDTWYTPPRLLGSASGTVVRAQLPKRGPTTPGTARSGPVSSTAWPTNRNR